jgi:hypothetical protein
LGAATVLTLSLTVPASEDVGRSAAGWAAHLEMLPTALLGATARFPIAVFKAAREAYADQVRALRRQEAARLAVRARHVWMRGQVHLFMPPRVWASWTVCAAGA